jgi:hypothetical protein
MRTRRVSVTRMTLLIAAIAVEFTALCHEPAAGGFYFVYGVIPLAGLLMWLILDRLIVSEGCLTMGPFFAGFQLFGWFSIMVYIAHTSLVFFPDGSYPVGFYATQVLEWIGSLLDLGGLKPDWLFTLMS